MKHEINPERTRLTLIASDAERAELMDARDESPETWGTTQLEVEVLENLLANSEIQGINPDDTGDLTCAPMLGILGEEQRQQSGPYGAVHCGGDEHGPWFQPIMERWAFMDYQVRSFLDDLANHGTATFIS